jgi:hypothetical protein
MEHNKLIAEFMDDYFDTGLEPAYYIRYNKEYKIGDSQFHKSWDWLMPVVEKIESLDLKEYGYQWEGIDGEIEYNNGSICVEIERNHCWIWVDLSLDPPHTLNEKTSHINFPTKIEATYAAVVEFIEYYNELITRKDED